MRIPPKEDLTIILGVVSLRQRNRRNAMRLTQRRALDLFIERGFDAVTVAEIAETVGMAASTLYRHFETKEAIVLWDEHDQAIDSALDDALRRLPPFAAIREVFVEELGGRYDADLDFQLTRIRYIYATEQLHAAAVEADFRARDELTRGLEQVLARPQRSAAPIIAGAAMLALDVAIDRWQQAEAKTPLDQLIGEAFDHLSNLDRLG